VKFNTIQSSAFGSNSHVKLQEPSSKPVHPEMEGCMESLINLGLNLKTYSRGT